MVESDEMPEDREALSAEEKKILRQWIDGGAQWPAGLAMIDPAIYVRPESPSSTWVETCKSEISNNTQAEATDTHM